MMMITVRRVREAVHFATLRETWNQLAQGQPLCGWEWLHTWWEVYAQPNWELFLLLAHDAQDQVIGIAPLFLESSSRGRVLRCLGSGEACTDHLAVLCQPGAAPAVTSAIARWLAEGSTQAEHRWDVLEVEHVTQQQETWPMLLDHLERYGCRAHRRTADNLWVMQLPPDWETYLSSCNKSRRKRLRKLAGEVEQPAWQFHVVQHAAELAPALQILIDLHQRRRQSLGEPGCFASQAFTRWINSACRRLLDNDQLLLCYLLREGRPAAAELSVLGAGTVYLYQSGIDPQLADDSPGRLINVCLLQHCLARGYRGFDFLRGDEPYKAAWGGQAVPAYSVRVAANHLSGQLRQNMWLAGTRMKEWVKSWHPQVPSAQDAASGPVPVT